MPLVTWVNSISAGQPAINGQSISTTITVTGTTDTSPWASVSLTQQSLQNGALALLFTGNPAGAQHATSATVTATFQAPLGVTSVTVEAEKNTAHKNLLE
jgi:hypothetical protein